MSGAQPPTPTLPRALRPLAWMEEGLAFLFAHPLLTLQVVLFWLIAWGGLGTELGLDDLLWHQNVTHQFVVGLCVGFLFTQVLFVRYLLVHGRREVPLRWTLFPVKELAIRRLGLYLLLTLPPCLIALGLPRLLMLRTDQTVEQHLPLLVGLAVSFCGSALVVGTFESTGLRARMQRTGLFRMMPGVAWGYLPVEDHPLHSVAFLLAILIGAGVTAAGILHSLGHVLVSPYLALCLILAIVNVAYGFLACQLRGLQHLVFLGLVLSGLLLNSDLFDRDHDYRMSFPHMEPYYAAARQAANEQRSLDDNEHYVRLDEERWVIEGQKDKRIDYYRELQRDPAHSAQAAGLIDSVEPLRAMCQRWQEKHPGTKPRIVLVATSGGGIRAAVWTAVVLEGLEETVPGLREHIRLITGASGGMVGAGLYVADFERPSDPADIDPRTGLGTFSRQLATDSLSPTVQTMLLTDLPSVWLPRPRDRDRGRDLELAWFRNARRPGEERSPFERTFAELRDSERQGLRPSLVYCPMMVEDSRRLIISNLDFDHLTESYGQQLGVSAGTYAARDGLDAIEGEQRGIRKRSVRALSAVEFFRLFPRATGFQISTAARMNASFPLVSPAVNLPTWPPRRVVDAGYYDNYGINLAAMWLFRHHKAIKEYTSGVLLVEIRAYRNGYSRRHFQDAEVKRSLKHTRNLDETEDQPKTEPAKRDLVSQSVEGLATPAEAVLTARDRACQYRNDELLHLVDLFFNDYKDPKKSDFFVSVAFECEKDAALSWMLPRQDAANIREGFWNLATHKEGTDERGKKVRAMPRWIEERVEETRAWFGKGGK